MAMAAREIPDIARTEVIGLRAALRVDDRGAHMTLGDKSPLRCRGMPMKLPHHTRLHAHGNTCKRFGDRQLSCRGLLAIAAVNHTPLGFFQFEFEGWKFLSGRHGIWNVILETIVAAFGTDGDAGREHEGLLADLCAAREGSPRAGR